MTLARANNITLRNRRRKAALKSIAQQAQTLSSSGLNVRFSIIEFASEIVRQLPVTANYGSVSARPPTRSSGRSTRSTWCATMPARPLPYALREAAQRIPVSGNGKTAATPRTVAFLITDGMANSNRNISSTEWRTDWNWGSFLPPAYFSGDWSEGPDPRIKAGLACPDPKLLLDQWQNPNPQSYFVNLPSGCVVDPHWLGNESHPADRRSACRQDQTVLSEIRPSWATTSSGRPISTRSTRPTMSWAGAGEPTHNYAR